MPGSLRFLSLQDSVSQAAESGVGLQPPLSSSIYSPRRGHREDFQKSNTNLNGTSLIIFIDIKCGLLDVFGTTKLPRAGKSN